MFRWGSAVPARMSVVSNVITVAAQGLPFLPVLVLGVVWLLASRPDKKQLAVSGVVVAVLATVLTQVAGAVHADPRPFVVDPASPALFPHPADNGFPSDHTVYAATAALLVATVRRRLGAVLLLVAIVGGLARVAANVHHLQDIAGALAIAALAVAAAVYLTRVLTGMMQRVRLDRRRERAPAVVPGQVGSER